MRADARRNRGRLLEVAYRAFATEGLSVSVHEIARRAGVSTGTLSRHFPTKDDLFEAIIHDRVSRLVQEAEQLRDTLAPEDAFFAFFRVMAEASASDRGLADAMAGVGFDVEGAAAATGRDVVGALGELLRGAQLAGAVGKDVDTGDVKALLLACSARGDSEARDRLVAVVSDGLRATAKAT